MNADVSHLVPVPVGLLDLPNETLWGKIMVKYLLSDHSEDIFMNIFPYRDFAIRVSLKTHFNNHTEWESFIKLPS